MIRKLRADISRLADPEKAGIYARYFKTGPGEYGEGDRFIGLTVPQSRSIARKYKSLEFPVIEDLLHSPIHEERLIALLILVEQFQKGDKNLKGRIYKFYLDNTAYINNWDLVDLSADRLVGAYLQDKPRNLLVKLASSISVWERRIAVLATFHFIKQGDPKDTLKIAKMLLNDKSDLIQKAVGWMLREVGKRCSEKVLVDFLDQYTTTMPRTALRYATERFPEKRRQYYLALRKT